MSAEMVEFTPCPTCDRAKELVQEHEAVVAELSSYKHRLFKVNFDSENYTEKDDREPVDGVAYASAISSELADKPGYHTVMLDLDVPAKLIPSSTPGHSHLYIDVKVHWEQLRSLLIELSRCGVVEPGYADVSCGRQATHLRLPWIKK